VWFKNGSGSSSHFSVLYKSPGGQDYGFFPAPSINFSLSIPAAESQLTYPIIIRDDNVVEPRESFFVTLLLPSEEGGALTGNLLIGTLDKTTVFIIDGDGENSSAFPLTTLTLILLL